MAHAMADNMPGGQASSVQTDQAEPFGFIQPVNGMRLAMDPRIPDDHEIMACQVAGVAPGERLTWYLDGKPLTTVTGSKFNWQIHPGSHLLEVAVTRPERPGVLTENHGLLKDSVRFLVNGAPAAFSKD